MAEFYNVTYHALLIYYSYKHLYEDPEEEIMILN